MLQRLIKDIFLVQQAAGKQARKHIGREVDKWVSKARTILGMENQMGRMDQS